jgi:hypothetical protein
MSPPYITSMIRHVIVLVSTSTTANMSRPTVPSLNILSTFSGYLKHQSSCSFSSQCHRLTKFVPSTSSRTAPGACLRTGLRSDVRNFSSSPTRKYKTVQEQRSRYRSGVRTPTPDSRIHYIQRLIRNPAFLVESRPPLLHGGSGAHLLFPL